MSHRSKRHITDPAQPLRMRKSRVSQLPTRSQIIRERNEAMSARFNQLYNEKRVRMDDVIEQLTREFFLSSITILRILRSKAS